jgi:hypothetical protein
MGLTTDRKADKSYKLSKGVAQTSTQRASYEETHPVSLRVFPSQIWLEASLIQPVAPGGADGDINGVVKRVIDLVLTQEAGKPNAWYNTELVDAIDPERFGASYLIVLKRNDGTTVPPGSGNYEVDVDAGVVTFDDSYVPTGAPLKISFYKYVGAKGVSSGSGVSDMWLTDVAALRLIDTHNEGEDLSVFSTSRVYTYVSASTLPDDGVSVIKPADVSDSGRWVAQKVIASLSSELELGAAPYGSNWTDGLIPVTEASLQNDFNLQVSKILKLIAPERPATMDNMVLTMSTYSARQAGSGTIHTCTDDTTPTASIASVNDPQAGDVSAEVDAVESGRRTLTTRDDTGVYSAMTIVSDTDPYDGQTGKEGFYKVLNITVTSTAILSIGSHSYRTRHTSEGDSQLLAFWVDDPTTGSISSVTVTRPASAGGYVSGVPTLSVGQIIGFDFNVVNVVKSHYNATRLAALFGSEVSDLDVTPPIVPPAANSTVSYIDQNLSVEANKYTESASVTITPYNSKGVAGTPSVQGTACRIDTVSSEVSRKIAGSGQYPATGYGSAFDSTQSLKTVNTEELQMLNGQYQFPGGNYASAQPTAGPDYSSGMGTGNRRCMPIAGFAITAASGFTITFNNPTGMVIGDLDTSTITIQVKVEGQTGWLDANKAFSLVGAPSVDGDACMVYSESSAAVRRVSFGNSPKTGTVYLRIGLPAGSTKKFGGVTISAIV